jgi:hypothetical protein
LKAAFEGKLVSQDISEESAQELLERIKTERFSDRRSKFVNQVELSRSVK